MTSYLIRIVAVIMLLLTTSPLAVMAAPAEPFKPEEVQVVGKTDPDTLGKIEPLVLKELAQNGTTTYLVYMREKADLTLAAAKPDKLSRRYAVVATLQETAQRSQASVLAYLDRQQAAGHVKDVASYWIFNGLAVTGDKETLLALAARPDVARIQANHVRRLPDVKTPGRGDAEASSQDSDDLSSAPLAMSDEERATMFPRPRDSVSSVEWNISKVRANEVWAALGITGQGVVVANMDTGVYYPHPALMRKYRGYNNGNVDHNYNWFDPTNTYPNVPNDGHGHGTHTMGTMVGSEPDGSNQIGVAPGAQWIAVKVFTDGGNTTDAILHAGFQWIMAPADLQRQNPDPSKAPDICSNSWGDTNSSDQTFWDDIIAWRAAGIMPVFAAGNNGPNAGTVDSPGSNPQSFAVGATNINDVVASFSGRGPSPWGELKPEVTAPGVNVRSSVPPSVNPAMYEGGWNGTSMATPHGAGLTALIWQARSDLSITATEEVLTSTAFPLPSAGSSPNNDYGWGRLDAFQAVSTIMNGGRFWGRAYNKASGQPIAGALITLVRQNGDGGTQTTTDAQGYYTLTVGAGIYTVTADNFWYIQQVVRDVEITAGFTTILDFPMVLKVMGVLRGQVSSGGTGITATLIISGVPLTPTTDTTGAYSVTLPAAVYDMRVRPASGYRQAVATSIAVPPGMETVRNFDLAAIPRILLVDADAWSGNSKISFYRNDLDALLYSYNTWTVVSMTTGLPPTATLGLYDIIIWHQPSASPGYIGAWPRLAGYLDNGGRLLISGQDIGYWDDSGDSRTYYRGYLHAQYLRDTAGLPIVRGVSSDLFTGISATLNTVDSANNQSDPDLIGALDAAATPVLNYTTAITTNGVAGLKVDTGSYQAIYLGFGLEGIGPQAVRQQTLNQALAWLSLPALRKTVGQPLAGPDEIMTYTLRLANSGAATVSNLSIVDPLPSALTYVDGSATGGLTYNTVQKRLEWQGGIAARTTLTFTFQARVAALPGGTAITNTAYLNSGAISLPTSARLIVNAADLRSSHKGATPSSVASGQEITYTVTLTNTAFGASLVNVVDPIPAHTAYVSGSATSGATYNANLNRVEWSGIITATDLSADDYTIITSDDPNGPAFSWMDISGKGTRIPAGDDTTHGPYDIGFPFTFYGTTYTGFYVSSNGWLSFQPPSGSFFGNTCLPDVNAPKPLLAVWWDDLNPTTGNVYYLSVSDTLILSYVGVPRFSSGGPYTFQVILREDGTITYQYLDMQGTRLNEATIGLQNEMGTKGASIVCNQDYVHNNLAILLSPRRQPQGNSFSFRVRVNDDAPLQTAIVNTALVSSMGITYTFNATSTANTVDFISSTKTVDKALASFSDSLVYTITVRNTGTATGTATLTDVLPAQIAYVADSATSGATYDSATRSIRWSGALGPGRSSTVSFAVTILPGLPDDTVITNTVVIADPLGRRYTPSATTLYRAADLSLSRKEASPTAVSVGQMVTYTVTVVNGGGGPTSFTVTDTLPLGMSIQPITIQVGHGTVTYDAVLRRLVWSGNLPGQHQTYLRFRARMDTAGTLTNTVQIRDTAGLTVERSVSVTVSGPTVTPTPTVPPGRPYRLLLPIIAFSED